MGEDYDSDDVLENDSGVLTTFINYVKDKKIVKLELLGAEFNLKTEVCLLFDLSYVTIFYLRKDVIKRVKYLQKSGALIG